MRYGNWGKVSCGVSLKSEVHTVMRRNLLSLCFLLSYSIITSDCEKSRGNSLLSSCWRAVFWDWGGISRIRLPNMTKFRVYPSRTLNLKYLQSNLHFRRHILRCEIQTLLDISDFLPKWLISYHCKNYHTISGYEM